MRYEKRWSNGFWRVFDTQEYKTMELCGTSIETDQRVGQYNRM
jgi:hypothetical protein